MNFSKLSASCLIAFFSVTASHAAETSKINLPGAVELSLNQNDDLQAKQMKLQADSEQINQAKARILPNIRLNGSYGYADYEVSGVSGLDDQYNRWSVSLLQTLYSRQSFLGVDRAEMSVDAAKTQFELDQRTKTLELVEAYLDYLKYSELLEISNLELEDHDFKVQRLQALLDRGLATKMDMLEANSTHDVLRANAVQIENDMRIRKVRLQRLLATSVSSVAPIDTSLWQRSKKILQQQDWYQTALLYQPSLRLAQQQKDVARIDIDAARAGYFPEVSLRAEASDADTYETSIERTNKIQIELSMPLYNGGETGSKVAAARAMLKSRSHFLDDQHQFVKVKLQETISRMQGNLAKIKALNESIASSEAYLDAAQKGLSYGLRGVFDVLEAKSRVYDSQRNLANEVYDNLMAQFEFLYLIGRLTPETIEAYLQPEFSMASLK